MRIALMTNNYKPFIGGVPISVERLANSLEKQGHRVTVFAPSYQGYTDAAGEHIIRYSSLLQKFVGGIVLPNPFDPIIEKEFRRQSFDVIHVHHPMLIGRTAVYLSKKYHIPLVFTYHTRYEQYVKAYGKGLIPADKFMPFYLHTFLKHCHHIIAPTEGMKAYLSEELGYDDHTITVLPTGIAPGSFQTDIETRERLREQYGAADIPLFISVSRMADEKNVAFLLKSVAEFKARYQKPFRLLMIGDGPGKPHYESLCRRLSLEKEVIFTGKVENQSIAPFYSTADAFLFASKTETQGIVILEAFASAAPVIAVDATGVRDLVKNDINGFLTEEKTCAFAERIQEIAEDSCLRRRLSRGALETAGEYTEEAVAKKALSLYNRVIAEYRMTILKNDRKVRALQWNGNIIF